MAETRKQNYTVYFRSSNYYFAILGIIFMVAFLFWQSRRHKSIFKEYEEITKKTELSDKIFTILGERGYTRFKMADGGKYISNNIKNQKRELLGLEAKPFDSIYKKKDCDTILLVRNGHKYYFWIGKY